MTWAFVNGEQKEFLIHSAFINALNHNDSCIIMKDLYP